MCNFLAAHHWAAPSRADCTTKATFPCPLASSLLCAFAAGKDTLDFYGDPSTRALYKLHIWGMVSRVNPLTGLAPKDDPAIFSFNIINEPRCPGKTLTCRTVIPCLKAVRTCNVAIRGVECHAMWVVHVLCPCVLMMALDELFAYSAWYSMA